MTRGKWRNKYNAVKTTVDGILFDSIKESNRYLELKILLRDGEISNLELKPVYPFELNGKPLKMGNGHIARYTADFRYIENGETIVEEVKGFVVRDYPLRKAVFEALYGIKIRET